jgi:hypothetical protein
MKNFDLNALGVTEMRKNELMEVNGGSEQPIPSPWLGLVKTIIDMAVAFFTEILPEVEADMCSRASNDGYVIWADVSHR